MLRGGETMAYVHACTFAREQDGEVEWGFYINEDTIIDCNGKVVEEVWNVQNRCSQGAFVLPENWRKGAKVQQTQSKVYNILENAYICT
jgi:hypothetical protein